MRASKQTNEPSKTREVKDTLNTWRGKGHVHLEGGVGINKVNMLPCFYSLFFPSALSLTQVTSRSLSALPCGALWSWSALLLGQCSSCFSSSSLFSLSLTIISVSITTARGWTWKIPHVRCVFPKTRRSRILSTISPRRGLAQVLSSSGLVSFVGLHRCLPAGWGVYVKDWNLHLFLAAL